MSPKSIAIVVGIAVVAAIAWPQIRKSRESSKVSSAEHLTGIVNSYQLRVPFTPRPNMVIDRVAVIDGVLNYAVRLEDRDEGNVRESDRAQIRRAVTSVICEEDEATALRRGGMTIRATVGDRTGTPITSVAVLPNGC